MDAFELPSSYTPRQRELLNAARRLLDAQGIAAFTMRSLAEETGLSPMAAYKHFENQHVLQVGLWRDVHSHFYDALLERSAGAADAAQAFLSIAEGIMRYAVQWPYRYELLFHHPLIRDVARHPEIEEQRLAVVDFARGIFFQAQADGLFRDDLPSELMIISTNAQVRGLASMLIYTHPGRLTHFDTDALINASLDFIREAVMPR